MSENEIDSINSLIPHYAHFDKVCEEIINLVNDYLDKNCVEFKRDDEKKSFKNIIKNKFEAIKTNWQDKIVIDNINSQGPSGQYTEGSKSVSNISQMSQISNN